jgi:DNA-binding transcriptional LysR family regulator
LFYRNSKGIEPTLEAKELYSYISTAFNIMKSGEEHIKSLNDLSTGLIKIGTLTHLGVFYLAPYIHEFRKIYPGIRFEIYSKSTDDMINMLETRDLDLVVDTLPISTTKKSIKRVILERLQNCFAYSKKHYSSGIINQESDLVNYPLILPRLNSTIRNKLNEYLETKNVILNPIVESWTNEIMIELVRQGAGIGYFIKEVIESQPDKNDFEIVTFNKKLPVADLCVVYDEEFSTAALNKFVNFILENRKVCE